METGYNIYEKIQSLEAELIGLRNKVEQYESNLQFDYKKSLMDDHDDGGYWTLNDILRKYSISRQCLFNYRKLIPLKKSTKIGRFDRFKKKNVLEFMNKIIELKKRQPELFSVKFNNA